MIPVYLPQRRKEIARQIVVVLTDPLRLCVAAVKKPLSSQLNKLLQRKSLRSLRKQGLYSSPHASKQFRLYALTNWSAETFPWTLDNFHFLHWFEGIVVSGVEKTRKPYPEFYHILLNRYKVDPQHTLFIDDNLNNIIAAKELGIHGIHFQGAEKLRDELKTKGIIS